MTAPGPDGVDGGLVALVLDDAGLLLAGPDGARLPPSPGVALVEGGEVVTGVEAAARRRRSPRVAHDRYWQELSTTPLGPPFPPGLSGADLAFHQLEELWGRGARPAEHLVVAAPGAVGVRQLGVLLGVARAVGIPVSGLVDLAVAIAADRVEGSAPVLHLEVYQHRAVATEVTVAGEIVRRNLSVEQGGWAALQGAWARALAELFLQRVRFDPLHDAASEQELYDRLPAWLAATTADSGVVARLRATGDEVAIEVEEADLATAVRGQVARFADLVERSVVGPVRPRLLLGARAASLPGLVRRLGDSAADSRAGFLSVEALAVDAAAVAALAAGAALSAATAGGPLPFVTRLPGHAPPGPRPARPVAARPTPAPRRLGPTHLLHAGIAHRLPPTGDLVLGSDPPPEQPHVVLPAAGVAAHHLTLRRGDAAAIEAIAHAETFVGGAAFAAGPLEVGARLRLGDPGIEVQLIAVEEE